MTYYKGEDFDKLYEEIYNEDGLYIYKITEGI